jgi:septal ring factor EnvC (AmiA/AmiB activator)
MDIRTIVLLGALALLAFVLAHEHRTHRSQDAATLAQFRNNLNTQQLEIEALTGKIANLTSEVLPPHLAKLEQRIKEAAHQSEKSAAALNARMDELTKLPEYRSRLARRDAIQRWTRE